MAELEVRVVSERRDGLLVELGHIVSKHHFTLLRQRMMVDPQGVSLTMRIRGPDDSQMALEEAIAVHPRVLEFESAHAPTEAGGSNPIRLATPASRSEAKPSAETIAQTGTANQVEVERILPSLAKDYPRIIPWLTSLGRIVAPQERAATLRLAGKRTGVWVYKRDFELGARLHLAEACKRIVLPAMQELVEVTLDGARLHLRENPLCLAGQPSGCTFFRGFIEGLLDNSVEPRSVYVRVAGCRSDGGAECTLEISH